MKSYRFITAFLVLLLIGSPEAIFGQTKKKNESREETKTEDVVDRIGSVIDRFVTKIGRFINEEIGDEEFVDEDIQDSTRKERSRRVRTTAYDGNTLITAEEKIDGDVVVKGGNLTVFGIVDGDVLVVGGNLYVKDGGSIEGNARVISGEIVRDKGGVIKGYMDKTRSSTASHRDDPKKFRRSSYMLSTTWLNETTNLDNFLFHYNRVEGLFLGLGSDRKYYWDGHRDYNAYGSIGYGFKSHRWRYSLGLTRQFPILTGSDDTNELLEFGVEGHSLTDTKDHWLIPLHENSLAALLLHEDFRDYFSRDGYAFHTAFTSKADNRIFQAKIEYRIDRYSSLLNRTEYAWFGGQKVFRLNPPVDDGRMRSIMASLGFSNKAKTMHGPEGWSIFGTAEYARRNFGSDFNFSQLLIDARRYQPIGRYDNLNIRLRAGTSSGTIPYQKAFDLGGFGTLPAYAFKEESGNRMILVNAEYILNGDFLSDLDFWPSWLMRGINFLFLADAGWVYTAAPSEHWEQGFNTLRLDEFRNNVGIGLSSKEGGFRIALAWRTDVPAPPAFILRIMRPF